MVVCKSDLHNDDNFLIAIDSTGFKVKTEANGFTVKSNVKRGYLKIHIAVDI